MLRIIIATLTLALPTFASGPGVPPGTKGLQDTVAQAQIILVGKVTNLKQRHFRDGKEFTDAQIRKIYEEILSKIDITEDPSDEDAADLPRFQTEFTVTLQVQEVLKGPLAGKEIQFTWRDLHDSMCPHINAKKGDTAIWYTGKRFKRDEHDHAVYWTSLVQQKDIAKLVSNEGAEQAEDADAE